MARGRTSRGRAGLFITQDSLTPTLQASPRFLDRAIFATLRFHESEAESYAKLNAPWTDQTANARNGLFARSGRTGSVQWLVVAHSVPYGIWLEVRFAGRNAIIMPTIAEVGPRVMETLAGILNRRLTG